MSAFVRDEQTGEPFELRPEGRIDQTFAWISIGYLLAMLGVFFWQLFDIWIGQFSLIHLVGYTSTAQLDSPSFLLPAYAFIGGGLGGAVNGIRSFLVWHSERGAFGRRYIWKYVTVPWLGCTLALFVYALIRSGLAVYGAEAVGESAGTTDILAAFATGAIAGYGSRDAFIWLDAQVTKIFKVAYEARVPDLIGRTRADVEEILKATQLTLGQVSEEAHEEEEVVGTVIRQTPAPGSEIATGGAVDVTVATQKQP